MPSRRPDGPPAWAEKILIANQRLETRTRFIRGDLREEYDTRRGRWPRPFVDLWYVGQVLSLCLQLPPSRWNRSPANVAETVLQDVRFGARSLRRSWVFTATAVGTLALGVGATTAVFSVTDSILFEPLAYPDADRLAVIDTNTGGPGWYGASQPELRDFRERLGAFESLGAGGRRRVTLNDSTAPRRVDVALMSSEVLPLLAVPPALGRVFTAGEDLPGGPNVLVASHAFWRQELGGDPDALGSTLSLDGAPVEVIGVMPEGFAFPDGDVIGWAPLRLDPVNPNSRANHNYAVIGRLRPGVSYEAAAAELAVHTARVREAYPENYEVRGYRTRLQSLHESTIGSTRRPLLLLLGGALLVLLVACVNVSNLLLARGDARETELAVRGALGAGRLRVARQLLIESGLVALAGGVVGLALAFAGIRGLVALAPSELPRLEGVAMDGRAALVSLGLVIGSLLIIGLVPALHGVRGDLRAALGATRGGSARRSKPLRRALVISQLSLAGLLAIGAGIMLRTLSNLYDTDLGFRPEGTLSVTVSPAGSRYPDAADRNAFYREVLTRIEAIPGVENAGAHLQRPLDPQSQNWSLATEDAPPANISEAPDSWAQITTPGYFDAMGIALLEGRLYAEADGADAPPVAVVSRTMARVLWPDEPAPGKRFRMFAEGWPWVEVIGVVADVRAHGIDRPAEPRFYAPHAQAYRSAYFTPLEMHITVRAPGDPAGVAGPVRSAIAAVDPTAPVSDVRTMERRVVASVANRRFTAALLQAFGAVALVLAAVGVYGVMSLAVSDRARELGLRKALGAPDSSLVGMVLRESLVLAVAGALLAVAGGAALGRLIRSLLFGVEATDPLTLGVVGLVLTATAALAALVPAARASRVDPMEVLRAEG